MLAALPAVLVLSAAAQVSDIMDAGHGHEPLPVDTTLSLADAVDMTLPVYPGTVELAARQQQAEAWLKRSRSWTANRPVAMFRYQTDRYGDDAGLREIEAGIQLTLWQWGERASSRSLAEALSAESGAAVAALRWEVAGAVRRVGWNLERTQRELELAGDILAVTRRLTTAVERRYELGDVAQGDLLLAQATELEARVWVNDMQAAELDAERAWRNLTGMDRRPALEPETLSAREVVGPDHPALAFAEAELERARARRDLVRESALTNPTLTIGPRQERSLATAPYEESIGMVLTVPFGGGAHVGTGVAAAGRDIAAAAANFRRLARDLDLALHEAAHALAVARANLEAARRRAELAERRYVMGESAYAKGELGLVELLNLQRVAIDARRQVVNFDVEQHLQTALYNQAVGVMP